MIYWDYLLKSLFPKTVILKIAVMIFSILFKKEVNQNCIHQNQKVF